MEERTCSVDGCQAPYRCRGMCSKHYRQALRTGSPDTRPRGRSLEAGSWYRRLSIPGHPLADQSGRVLEHRVVLHAVIGEGPHPCHWCGRTVVWVRAEDDEVLLVVDHLDENVQNNTPANLVPSCSRCNSTRRAEGRAA